MSSSSNKRIAKNTLMLYVRMLFTMIIGLFTSRIVLNALGVSDYGVYSVVGGFVGMFSVVSGAMSASISRFITFELGRNDLESSCKVFSTSLMVQIIMSLLIVLITETIGLWFLNNKMVIPDDRQYAAMWVFQLSVVTFVVSLLSVPYNSAIIAHEDLGRFAFFSIVESFIRLGIVLIVKYAPTDKLILYAILGCVLSFIMRIAYMRYCKLNYKECQGSWFFDKSLLKTMFSFAGWNTIGSSAAILQTQGGNVLLNLFGGPIVNAAAGIAATLTGIVQGLVSNFTVAFNPQITKSYASGDFERLHVLLFSFSRFSFYIMFFCALPVYFNAEFILKLWLGTVPDHTVNFIRIVIINILVDIISSTIITAKNATGKIRNYQIVIGGILLFSMPLSYLLLTLNYPIEVVYVVNVFTSFIAFFARMFMLRDDIPLWSSLLFFKKVFINVLCVAFFGSIVPALIYCYIHENIISTFLITFPIGIITSILAIFYVGCNNREREFIMIEARNIFHKVA